jgi:hypothetical protein
MAIGEFERRVQQVLESPHKASVQEVLVLLQESLAFMVAGGLILWGQS